MLFAYLARVPPPPPYCSPYRAPYCSGDCLIEMGAVWEDVPRRRDEACPVGTGGGTRRVHLVRGEGRGVST